MREFTRAVQCQNCVAHWYEPEDYEPRESCPHCPSDDLMLIGEDSEYYTDDGKYDPQPCDIGSDPLAGADENE